jgi:hypothetical protein
MARLVTCGWETAVVGEGGGASSTTYSVVTTPVRSGQYALQPAAGQTPVGVTYGSTAANNAAFTAALDVTYFIRLWIYFAATGGDVKLGFVGGGGGSINNVDANLNASGQVELRFNGVVKATSAVLATGAWHLIELSAKITSTTSDVGQLRVNGTDLGTFTADANMNTVPTVGIANHIAGSTVVTYDDLAINDSTGATQNSWPDHGKLLLLKPVADSAKGAGWTTDSAGTTNFFTATAGVNGIADTTAGDGTHQIRNAASNANSAYDAQVTDYATAGVTAGDTIRAVQAITLTGAPVTTSAKLGTVGVVSNPAGTMGNLGTQNTAGAFWGGSAASTPGGWKWSYGPYEVAPSVTLGTRPVVRINQVTASTRIAMVDFLGLYVDYTPPGGTTYNDSGSGTVTSSGGSTESYRHDSSSSGTVTASGTGVESYSGAVVNTDTGAGTITAAGTGTETAARTGTGAGTVTASGTGVEAAAADDSRTGASTASGAAIEATAHAASGTGTVTGTGTGVETYTPPAVYVDTSSGTVTGTGSGVESYTVGGTFYPDTATGTVTATGSGVENTARTDTTTGTAAATGTGTESATRTGTGAGTVTTTGNGTEGLAHTAAGAGTIAAAGTGVDASSHDTTATGTAGITGTGTDLAAHDATGTAAATTAGAGTETAQHTGTVTGTVTADGAGVETYYPPVIRTDVAVGTVDVAGAGIDAAARTATSSGTVTTTGAGADAYAPPVVYVDTATATGTVTGTGVEVYFVEGAPALVPIVRVLAARPVTVRLEPTLALAVSTTGARAPVTVRVTPASRAPAVRVGPGRPVRVTVGLVRSGVLV